VLSEHGVPIAPSTYYDAVKQARRVTAEERREERLMVAIARVHHENYGVYGARKVWLALNREGIRVARCTVERLMTVLGLEGARRGRRVRTTRPDPAANRPADLVERNWNPSRPDALWVADFTYVPTWAGMVYVAFVLDAFSRRILGWKAATSMRAELVLDALEMAIWTRQRAGVADLSGLIHHTDAGAQYTSIRFTERLAEAGAAPSVGSVGDALDKDVVSHCTFWCGFGGDSFVEWAAHAFDQSRVGGLGWLEESLVLVVGLVRGEQPGAVPGLDGGGVHAEPVGDLADGEQSFGVEPVGVAGQVVAAA
jgi:putative transposase